MNPRFLFFSLLLIFPLASYSQNRCAVKEYEELIKKKYPEYEKEKAAFNQNISEVIQQRINQRITATDEVYTIPVVVHIIHNNASGTIGGPRNTNISDEQVLSQIQVLNEDYRRAPNTPGFNDDPVGADVRIEFCLATRDPQGNETNGIVRKYHDRSVWSISDDSYFKDLSYWPSDQYLNIWVLNLSQGYLGYSQFPPATAVQGMQGPYSASTDGVVVDYEAFGTLGTAKAPYNKGRTTTHEVGHWFGLIHIWGDREGPPCGTDYVSDTPPDAWQNEGPSCSDSSDCDRNGIYTPDMTNNYMDYSPDLCMNIFTQGQKTRMRTVIETTPRRAALLNSPGCCGGGNLTLIPYLEDFEEENIISKGWEIYSPGMVQNIYTFPGSNSTSSLKINPAGYFSGDTAENKNYSYLISPFLSYAMESDPVLSFDLAYTGRNDKSETDSLVLSYQVNCQEWIHLETLSGTDLITSARMQPDFNPTPDDWRNHVIKIPQLKFKTVARLRFEFFSKGVNNLYLDNINIHQTSAELSVIPFPNPVKNNANFKISFTGVKNIKLEVFNFLGELVLSDEYTSTRSFLYPFNADGLSEGIYFARVSDGSDQTVVRFMVRK